MDRIATTQGLLARRGFADAEVAARVVAGWAADSEAVLDLVAETADPDLALTAVDRLQEVRPGLVDRLLTEPVLATQLLAVLGGSAALGRHLVAHPAQVDLVAEPVGRTPAAALRRELLQAVAADPDAAVPVAAETTGDPLRVAYRGALLRIAVRDLCAPEPIEVLDDVAVELSDLADATLEAALAIARGRVGPGAERCRLAVVGLGKCGAQELNYVSDVDVLFVAEPVLDADGTPRAEPAEALQIATRLAGEVSRICSAHTAAGTIWEVDAALRPEGKAGQLVRTLASHQVYYEKWAKTWEFQAMLKARPAAGDLELGQAFVDLVAP
ncbi:MAG: bifunctional glutamine-synthetase adenylyltransferase/deadenyltransferase, partial [Actinomycetes bacterium]